MESDTSDMLTESSTTEQSADIQIHLKPSVIGEVAGFPITNAIIMAVIITISMAALFAVTARRMTLVPGKVQLLVESFISYCYSFVTSIFGDGPAAKRIFPLFITLFVFFLASNLVGFIPGVAAVSFNDLPLFRAPTSSYAAIFVITMVIFIGLQITVLVTAGLTGYVKQFINFDSPIDFAMGLLNIIGEASKVVSLSFRLFGNIFAGEVIATVIIALLPIAGPQVPFSLLGLLSSLIQALVFPLLVIIYFKMGLDVRTEYEASLEAKKQKKLQNTTPAAEMA